MRKTSQDGGDSTSVTSGVENEIKKPILSILKTKKGSLKRNVPNLSEESDETVIEPLLIKDKERNDQSAQYFAKAKADTVKEISKLFNDKKSQYASTSSFGTTETLLSEKEHATPKSNPPNAPLHNYMNTNVFHSHDTSKSNVAPKTQVLVEIDVSKQSGYNPSPLIFTTAKIHTEGKSKQMEPVQVTPSPILSTIEVSVSKGSNVTNEKKFSNGISVMNSIYSQSSNIQASSKEDAPIVLSSNNIPTQQQSKDMSVTNASLTNAYKPATQHNPKNLSSPLETSQSIISGIKNDKNEPRILLSESKLKSVTKEKAEQQLEHRPLYLSTKQHQTNLPYTNKIDKSSENNNMSKEHIKTLQNIKVEVSQQLQTKATESLTSLTSVASKPNQNSTSIANDNNPIISDHLKEPSAKTKLIAAKATEPTDFNDSKLIKEINKLPKTSANDLPKSKSKLSLNNTASSSTNKVPTSSSIPATNVSSSNDLLVNVDNMPKKVIENTLSDPKARKEPSTITTNTNSSKIGAEITTSTVAAKTTLSSTIPKTTVSSGTSDVIKTIIPTTTSSNVVSTTTASSFTVSTTMPKTTISPIAVSSMAAIIATSPVVITTTTAKNTGPLNATTSVDSKNNISFTIAKTTLPSSEMIKTNVCVSTAKSTSSEIPSTVPKTNIQALPVTVDNTSIPSSKISSTAKTTSSNLKTASVGKIPVPPTTVSSTPSKTTVSSTMSKTNLPANTIPSTGTKTPVSSGPLLSSATTTVSKSTPNTKTTLASNGIPSTIAKSSLYSKAASSEALKTAISTSAIASTVSTKTTTAAISTVNTKPMTTTSTKASKPSIKSPQGSAQTSNKQPNVSAAKAPASKSSVSSKTLQGNVTGHSTAPVVKSIASKTAQASKGSKSTGPSAAPPETFKSSKAMELETKSKCGSKPSDHPKTNQVPKS